MRSIEDHNWILNIIKSCNNDFHFEGVDKLIELFSWKHHKAPKFDSLLYDLISERNKQWDIIHSILK